MNEQTIFTAAIEQDADQRAAFLDRACGADDTLRRRVERLLAQHDSAGSFLEHPAAAVGVILGESISEHPGSRIGPYHLLEQIGEGGMGAVYLAEQKEPVRRKVALKVIKPGMDTRQVVARFEAERQALAMMNHPSIAKVLDAGATEAGRPYFVMELVKGLPITEFCDQHQLTTRERLELFITVCQAVQHAHQKGLIHRDLKPSNVLVEMHDVIPVPKVIDFGVAKAIGHSLTEKTLHTAFSQLVGTPLYMSPEQAGQSSIDVDTRSDIYSLGVLLYELLTGSTPFDRDTLENAGSDEMRRMIREVNPPRPSARVSTLQAQALSTLSSRRQVDSRKLSQQLRGELDWILMKALEKDRTRRYETASSLAADLQCYLNAEPVLACPPSARYRFGKFALRNKAAIATGALIAITLLLGLLGTTWQAIRATRAEGLAEARFRAESESRAAAESAGFDRLRAEANFHRAKSVVDDYLTKVSETQLLSVPGLQPLRRDLLTSALTFYQGFLKEQGDDPSLKAELAAAYLRVGKIFNELEERDRSRPALQQAQRLYRSLIVANTSDPSLQAGLADALSAAGAHEEAGILWESLVRSNPLNPQFRRELAHNYNGIAAGQDKTRIAEMLQLHEQALVIWEVLASEFPDDPEIHASLGVTLNSLGALLSGKDHPEQSLAMFRRAVEHFQIAHHQLPQVVRHGQLLATGYGNVAHSAQRLDRLDEAIEASTKAVGIWKRLTQDNPALPHLQSSLRIAYGITAALQHDAGRHDEADLSIGLAREILERLPIQTPNEFYDLARYRACAAGWVGRGKEGLTLGEQHERRREADLAMGALWQAVAAGYRHVDRILANEDFAELRQRDDFQTLVALLRTDPRASLAAKLHIEQQLLATRQTTLNDGSTGPRAESDLAASRHAMGLLQSELGRTDEAITSLNEALAERMKLVRAAPEYDPYVMDLAGTYFALGEVYWGQQRLSEAESAFQAALTQLKSRLGTSQARVLIESMTRLVDRYAQLGLWDQATAAQEVLTEFSWQADAHRQFCLALLYAQSGESEQYRRLCQDLLARYSSADDPSLQALFWTLEACLLQTEMTDDDWHLERAAQLLTDAVQEASSDWRQAAWHLQPTLDYRAGRYEQAAEGLKQGLKDFNGPITARYLLAMAQFRLGRSDVAQHLLRVAEATDPTRLLPVGATRIENWAPWLAQNMLWREAFGLIEDQPAPQDLHLQLLRARAYDKFKQVDRANTQWEAAVVIGADHPHLWLERASRFATHGDRPRAMADFQRAATLQPDAPEIWVAGGRLAAELKIEQLLVAHFNRAAELLQREDPKLTLTTAELEKRSLQRAGSKDWDAATVDFARLLDRLPLEAGAISQRKDLCLKIAEQPELFLRMVGLRPADAELWIARGRLHALRGDWEQAFEDFQGVMNSLPAQEEWIEYGALCLLTGRTEHYQHVCRHLERLAGHRSDGFAQYVLSMSCALSPDSGIDSSRLVQWGASGVRHSSAPWCQRALALAQYRAGRYEEALWRLEQSDQQQAAGSTIGSTLNGLVSAMVLQRLDRSEDARTRLTSALSYITQRTPLNRLQPAPLRALHWLQAQVLLRESQTLVEPSIATEVPHPRLQPADPPQELELILRRHTRAALTVSPDSSADMTSWLAHARMLTALGEDEPAAAGFSQVLEKLPLRQISNSTRKMICLEVVRRPEIFARLTALRPDDIDLRFAHARLHSLRSDWANAYAEYAGLIEKHPRNTEEWCEYACLCLLNGDNQQYQQVCHQLNESQGMTTDWRTGFFLTRAAVLSPISGIAPERLIAWGKLATETDRSPWKLTALAMAHYRTGQFSLAAEVLKEAQGRPWAAEGKAQLQLAQALTFDQLGQRDEAVLLFEEANRYIQEQTPSNSTDPAAGYPIDWMTLHVMRSEGASRLRP
jgi:eukaryotic-like serine/threonine-protein kinase